MNDLQIFNNDEFGEIRTIVIGNEPWLVGKDVAKALGYGDADQALRKHVDKDDKLTRQINGSGQLRSMTIINESGLYALIFGSKLESAKKFKHWVTSEVLPAIRKTGRYEMLKKEKHKHNELSSVNMMTKNITDVLKNAGVEPLFIAAEVAGSIQTRDVKCRPRWLLTKKPCQSCTTVQRSPRSWALCQRTDCPITRR